MRLHPVVLPVQLALRSQIFLGTATLAVLASNAPAQPPEPAKSPFSNLFSKPAHQAEIPPRQSSLALSPDRKIAVTGSEDGTITLWDTNSGKELRQFTAHQSLSSPGYYNRAVFSPDGLLLATSGSPRSRTQKNTTSNMLRDEVKLWNVSTGQLLHTFTAEVPEGRYSSRINMLAFSPDGKTLATGGRYQPVDLWDTRTGKLIRSFRVPFMELNALAFSPDGKTLAGGGHRNEFSNNTTIAHSQGEVILWDTGSGRLLRSLRHLQADLSDQITTLVFSPDGQTLATGGMAGNPESISDGSGYFNTQFGTIQLWDLQSGVLMTRLGKPLHRQAVYHLSFSPDGQRIASGSSDNVVALWDVNSGRALGHVTRYGTPVVKVTEVADGKPGETSKRETTKEGIGVRALAFSPDGKTLQILGHDKSMRSWNVGGETIESDPLQRVLPAAAISRLNSFAFAPNNRYLASANYGTRVRIWNTASLEERDSWYAHQEAVNKVAFAPYLADSPASRQTDLLATGAHLMEWRRTSETSARGHIAGFEVKLWNPRSHDLLHTLKMEGFGITALAISPDRRFVAAAGAYIGPLPKGATMTPNQNGVELRVGVDGNDELPGLEKGEDIQDLRSLIAVWDTAFGELKHKFMVSGDTPTAIVFSPDGKTLTSDCGEEGIVSWNLINGEQTRVLDTDRLPPLKPGEKRVRSRFGLPWTTSSLAITPDGKNLIRSRKGKIQVWDNETGQPKRTLLEDGRGHYAIALSPSGKILASGGLTAKLQLHDVETGNLLWESEEARSVQMLEFSPDGKTLATDFESGIRLWNLADVTQGKVN